jgi:hypothetical protein
MLRETSEQMVRGGGNLLASEANDRE